MPPLPSPAEHVEDARERADAGGGKGWQVPVAVGPLWAVRPAETVLLQGEPKDIAAGRCGEPLKLNVGDIGYYRVAYDAAGRAALAKSFALMPPADRVNVLADSWALVEASRGTPASYLELVEEIGGDESHAAWEQVIRVVTRLDRLQRGRRERPALQAYARTKLRPAFDRLRWDEARPEAADDGPLRARLIRTLGEFGDKGVLRSEAAVRRLPAESGVAVAGAARCSDLPGRTDSGRARYDILLSLARKTTKASERERYYMAAASARDPALARGTLDLALTDASPRARSAESSMRWHLPASIPSSPGIFAKKFAGAGEQAGPSFRNYFVTNLLRNFSDAERATELASFAPAHATPEGRADRRHGHRQRSGSKPNSSRACCPPSTTGWHVAADGDSGRSRRRATNFGACLHEAMARLRRAMAQAGCPRRHCASGRHPGRALTAPQEALSPRSDWHSSNESANTPPIELFDQGLKSATRAERTIWPRPSFVPCTTAWS